MDERTDDNEEREFADVSPPDNTPADRVCNRLSGYSGYSDIRKNLSVRIVI